jgi:hypothetical protein
MRTTRYSQAVAEVICDRIAEGESVRAILRCKGMPSRSTLHEWLKKYDDFASQYAVATGLRTDLMFDEIMEIAERAPRLLPNGMVDRGDVEHRRLMIWARMWACGVMRPKKYGRLTLEAEGRSRVYVIREAGNAGSATNPDHSRACVCARS